MSNESNKNPRVSQPSLFREGKVIDMADISLEKIMKAQEKGFRFDIPYSWTAKGKVTAKVTKIIVKGDIE